MKAAIVTKYGPPEEVVIEERPVPSISADDILVRVRYATVQTADWRVRSLSMPRGMTLLARLIFGLSRPRQPVLGTEYSGEVVEVGAAVSEFKKGDEVLGTSGAFFGAHAELIKVSKKAIIVRKPPGLDFKEAAALPFGGLTALDYLRDKAHVRAGDRVLITGASGALGVAAVQIAKHLGAHVTAVCSEPNFELVKKLGADEVIDYRKENFYERGATYDLVFDSLGILQIADLRRATRPQGKILLLSATLDQMLLAPVWNIFSSQKVVVGVANESRAKLEELLELVARGRYRVIVDQVFPFERIVEAHRRVDSRHKRGNVVLEMANKSARAFNDRSGLCPQESEGSVF
jgi:NADPH:quinone reductase-like Zn-dependent oxidoreductase